MVISWGGSAGSLRILFSLPPCLFCRCSGLGESSQDSSFFPYKLPVSAPHAKGQKYCFPDVLLLVVFLD